MEKQQTGGKKVDFFSTSGNKRMYTKIWIHKKDEKEYSEKTYSNHYFRCFYIIFDVQE